jgi:hypothetical protein
MTNSGTNEMSVMLFFTNSPFLNKAAHAARGLVQHVLFSGKEPLLTPTKRFDQDLDMKALILGLNEQPGL